MNECRLYVVQEGPRGRIVAYGRPNGRCPTYAFLLRAPADLLKRFKHSFARFAESGYTIADNSTFKPNTAEGRGIWSWKEHDHRLLSFRAPDLPNGRQVNVLLTGWAKDKTTSLEERNQFLVAQALRRECEACDSRRVLYGTWLDFRPYFNTRLGVYVNAIPEKTVSLPRVADSRSQDTTQQEIARGESPVQEKEEPVTETNSKITEAQSSHPLPKPPTKEGPVAYFEVCCLAEVPYKWALRNSGEGKLRKPGASVKNGRTIFAVPYAELEVYVQEMRALRSRSGKPFGKQATTESKFVPLVAPLSPTTTPTAPTPPPSSKADLVRFPKGEVPPGLVTAEEAARMYGGVGKSTVWSATYRGRLPVAGVQAGTNRKLYRKVDVATWIAMYKPKPGMPQAKHAESLRATLAQKQAAKTSVKRKANVEIPKAPTQVPGRTDLHKLLDSVLAERKPISVLIEAVEKHVKARKTIRELQEFLVGYKKRLA